MRLLIPTLLLALSSVSAAAVPQERTGKTRSSANGLYAIRVVEEPSGRCRVEVHKGQQLAWTLRKCVASVDDLVFIDNSGKRFWVLHALPRTPKVKGKPRRVAPHFQAVVARLYDQRGRTLRAKRLRDFLQTHRLGLVRQLGLHFKWLEGVYDVPGKLPRVTDQNVVEFETVASKTHTLRFR